MKIEIVDIFSFITVFLFILFSIFLVTYKNNNQTTRNILAAFLLSKSLAVLNFLLYRSKEYFSNYFPHLFFIGDSFAFIFGPALFYFTQSLTNKHFRLKINMLIHLVPFFIYIAYRISSFHILDVDAKQNLLMATNIYESDANIIIYSLLHIHILVYIMASIVRLSKYQKEIKLIYSSISRINLSWLNIILFGFTIIWLLDLSNFILWITIGYPNWTIYTFVQFLLILFASVLVVKGLNQPVLFAGLNNGVKYKDCRLKENEREQWVEKLIQFMETDKPYLNSSITLNEVADSLSIQPHLLSQIINESLQMNFYNFINSYRIEKAKEILSDTAYNHQTILGVLIDVGFNSKSSFNSAFKNFTGLTPRQYKTVHQSKICSD